jgi:hypothetical protein
MSKGVFDVCDVDNRNAGLNILFSNRYMFRSYDHLHADIYLPYLWYCI